MSGGCFGCNPFLLDAADNKESVGMTEPLTIRNNISAGGAGGNWGGGYKMATFAYSDDVHVMQDSKVRTGPRTWCMSTWEMRFILE
jgi:hypothetical protein